MNKQRGETRMGSCFYTVLDNQSNQVFYCDEGRSYTYAQLWNYIARARVYLKKQSIKTKQRVPISCIDPLNFIVGFFSIISLDACAVLIENKKKDQEVLEILEQIDSKFILTDYLQYGDLNNYAVKNISFDLVNLPKEMDDDINCNMKLEGCIIFTSGSTSKPKGVIRSNRILFEHSDMLQRVYNLNCEDTVLCLVQPQHAFGLENILGAIYSGSTLCIQKDFSHSQTINYIEQGKCSIIVGVPYEYELLVKVNKKIPVNKLRYLLSAGAPLKRDTNIAIYNLFGIPVTQIYGSSELGATAINLDISKEFEYDSVGKPLSEIEIKIVDDKNCVLPHSQIGEIVLNSPYCTLGYLDACEAIKDDAYIKDGWFFSGDLGYINEKGNLFITGRKKNVINIAGKKVSPEEVEKVIKRLKYIKDVKVEGTNDSLYGETIIAKVVVKSGVEVAAHTIFNHCKKFLSDYKIPRHIVFADSLEYTSTGKLKR